MAQLSRVIQRIFGGTGGTTNFGQIGSQAAGAPQTTKDLDTIQSLSQFGVGLTGISVNQGNTILPYIEDLNSLYLLFSSQIGYLLQNGIPEWLNDADQRYYATVSFVTRNGNLYQAILGDDASNINAQRDPATETDWWRLIRTPEERGILVGEITHRMGNASAPTATFPRFCMTNFAGSTALSTTNWPDLVPYLRNQTAAYLEDQPGGTDSYTGTVTGSSLVLDDNAANNAILAALEEDRLAFGGSFTDWRTVDINTVTFDIASIDVGTRTIGVLGTPSAGAQEAIFYPHRIAGSTTTARVHSWVGRVLAGAGSGEVISGLLRRDRFQDWQLGIFNNAQTYYGLATSITELRVNTTAAAGQQSPAFTTDGQGVADRMRPFDNGTNGEPRTGSDTHGPDAGAHVYVHGGRYIA